MPLDLSKITDKLTAQRAINGALAIAVGVLVVERIAADDPQREVKLADYGDALSNGSAETKPQRADNLDTGELHRVSKAIRTADPQLRDLGGGLVEPGKTCDGANSCGGNFDRGTRLVAWEAGCLDLGGRYDAASMACLLGPGAASWAVLGSTCEEREGNEDATWCEVQLRNDSSEALRPIVFVRRGEP